MSKASISKLLPAHGDPRKFAQQGVRLSGSVPLESLPRLAQALQEASGEAVVDMQFATDAQGRRLLTGSVEAGLALECQRCLGTLVLPVRSEFALAVVIDDEAAVNLPRELDPWIVREEQASFFELVEEELLLSLPTVAVHEQPCIDKSLLSSGDADVDAEAPRENPFRVLEQLKGKR